MSEAAPPPEAPKMETHKPVRNWRGFLVELVIVVLGVGIALAAQQAVEVWREHREYAEARQAMRDELDYNVSNINRRDQFEPCIKRRLDEIGALLDRIESGKPVVAPSWIGAGGRLRIRFTAEPDASRSDLFTTTEQSTFGRLYAYLHSLDLEQDRERLAWARLQMLQGRSTLSPEMLYGLRTALADARFEHRQIKDMWLFLAALSRLSGVRSDVNIFKTAGLRIDSEVWSPCLPMDTPTGEAERRSQMTVRAP